MDESRAKLASSWDEIDWKLTAKESLRKPLTIVGGKTGAEIAEIINDESHAQMAGSLKEVDWDLTWKETKRKTGAVMGKLNFW